MEEKTKRSPLVTIIIVIIILGLIGTYASLFTSATQTTVPATQTTQ